MTAIEFPEVNVRIAEHQPEFTTLPAHHNEGEGSVTFCFKLTEDEINRMHATGKLWFKQIIGIHSFHPIMLSTNKEDLI